MWTEEGYQTEFVFRNWPEFVLGLLILLGGPPGFLVLFLLEDVAGIWLIFWAVFILPLCAFVGTFFMGQFTRIAFNQFPEEYMAVTRGHIPFFLRSLRVKRVFKEEAKTVRVRSISRGDDAWYLVEVELASGKSLKLYQDIYSGQADEIARTIRRWSGVEPGSGAEAKVS